MIPTLLSILSKLNLFLSFTIVRFYFQDVRSGCFNIRYKQDVENISALMSKPGKRIVASAQAHIPSGDVVEILY